MSSSLQAIGLARQVPLSMVFFRQEYWNGLPVPFPGDLPNPRIKFAALVSPVLQADSLPTEPSGKPLSLVQLFTTPWIVTLQALLSMQFSRQDYWSRLPFPSPGDVPLEKGSNPPLLHLLHWQVDTFTTVPYILSLCMSSLQ